MSLSTHTKFKQGVQICILSLADKPQPSTPFSLQHTLDWFGVCYAIFWSCLPCWNLNTLSPSHYFPCSPWSLPSQSISPTPQGTYLQFSLQLWVGHHTCTDFIIAPLLAVKACDQSSTWISRTVRLPCFSENSWELLRLLTWTCTIQKSLDHRAHMPAGTTDLWVL